LVYRQGVERTTLADIAQAADVRVGNASSPLSCMCTLIN
jgi:hypothetical protein